MSVDKLNISGALLLLASIFGANSMGAVTPSISTALDSSQVTMGYLTAVKINVVDSPTAPSQVILDKAAFPQEVEIVDWVYGDTTSLGNGMVEMKQALVIQSFDSGVYTIPPFLLVNGPDTLRSKALTLKVNPVDVSHMQDINPLAPLARFQSKWYDWLPDWLTDYWGWILFALLIVAAGVCAYLMLTKKVVVNILPQKKRLPPDQLAFKRLNDLREAQLWEKGQEKEYYTLLIDILRDYLQERFGINAMEMTSSQILRALKSNPETHMPRKYMVKVVEIADYVKFAKVRPLPDDNVRSWQNAVQFVEETKPVEIPSEDDAVEGETSVAEQDGTRVAREKKIVKPNEGKEE